MTDSSLENPGKTVFIYNMEKSVIHLCICTINRFKAAEIYIMNKNKFTNIQFSGSSMTKTGELQK